MSAPAEKPKAATEINLEYTIKDTDMIDLWKYFEEQGNTVKGRMLTIVTWLLAFGTGLLGFTVKELGALEGRVDGAGTAAVLSVFGLGICWYARKLIFDFGNHMERHWASADYLLKRLRGLREIRDGGADSARMREDQAQEDAKRQSERGSHKELPGICKHVLQVVMGLAVVFLIVLALSLISFFAAVPWHKIFRN